MKIIVIGATGLLGAPTIAEAAGRGHHVTAVCRHPEDIVDHPLIMAAKCDVFDTAALTILIKNHDAVIHAYSPRRDHTTNRSGPHLLASQSIIDAAKAADVMRILAVGGAGTLEVAPGVQLMTTPEFPAEYMESAVSTAQVLYLLRQHPELDWTFLCPSAWLEECGRTGKFRLGGDDLLVDEKGRSGISPEDYAMALIDELEAPLHTRQRFTVGY